MRHPVDSSINRLVLEPPIYSVMHHTGVLFSVAMLLMWISVEYVFAWVQTGISMCSRYNHFNVISNV